VKLKHNKKRNSAILYEILIKELTRSTVNEDLNKRQEIVNLIKKTFNKSTAMGKELELYRVLCEGEILSPPTAERLIYEARKVHSQIDSKQLFNEQTSLINSMNRLLSKSVFANFVPNYKSLATVSQIFNQETPIKKRVLLEESLIGTMSSKRKQNEEKELKPIDNLVYKTFVNKFNDQYSEHLFVEQKELLTKYISSFTDNSLQLKIYLNEEIDRLKDVISESVGYEDVKTDPEMITKTNKVLEVIKEFHSKEIDGNLIKKVLKIQNLAREIQQ